MTSHNDPLYLERYLASLETLPGELKNNFDSMADLDRSNKDMMVDIDSASDEYLRKVRDLSPGKRKAEMEKIQVNKFNLINLKTNCVYFLKKMFKESKKFADDKVHLAIQTYELVDKHIRKLDNDLAKFESEMKVSVLKRWNRECFCHNIQALNLFQEKGRLSQTESEEEEVDEKRNKKKTKDGKKKKGSNKDDDKKKKKQTSGRL